MHLARGHVQRHAVQDRLVGDSGVEVVDLSMLLGLLTRSFNRRSMLRLLS